MKKYTPTNRNPRELIITEGESAMPSYNHLGSTVEYQMEILSKSEASIKNYVEKCFKDAFEAEGRNYDPYAWTFEYIIVRSRNAIWHLLPINFWCKYDRVQRIVTHRLSRNLEKNFGIHYGKSEFLRYLMYDDGRYDLSYFGTIDPNWTEAMFKVNKRGKFITVSLSIIDCDPDELPRGETMIAARFEKLLFTYWGINAAEYKSMPNDDERKNLPVQFNHNWYEYWDLYKKTFGKDPGADYAIMCSSGVERIYGKDDEHDENS